MSKLVVAWNSSCLTACRSFFATARKEKHHTAADGSFGASVSGDFKALSCYLLPPRLRKSAGFPFADCMFAEAEIGERIGD